MDVAVTTSSNIRRESRLRLDFFAAFLFLIARTNFSKAFCNGFSPWYINKLNFRERHRFLRTSEPTVATVVTFSFPERSVNSDDSSEVDYTSDLLKRAEAIHVEKLRDQLEKANTKSFLKHAPWKLPYNDARLWIQANLGPNTKEEFYDLVENGNLRTPYIPKRPEEYYTRTREWISWDHFLTGLLDEEHPSAIQPSTGYFD